jgi:hypothetical protein
VARIYWLDLFTGTTWKEFLAAGGEVSGFRERRWKTCPAGQPIIRDYPIVTGGQPLAFNQRDGCVGGYVSERTAGQCN